MSEAMERMELRQKFPVGLGRVLSGLGISRDDERALRRAGLVEGRDWALVANKVCYAEEGVERLRESVAVKGAGSSEGSLAGVAGEKMGDGCGGEVGSPGGAAGGPRKIAGLLTERAGEVGAFLVRTVRCDFLNDQVVEVQEDLGARAGRGRRWFMRVRNSKNFLPGMACWARAGEGSNLEFVGRGDRAVEALHGAVCPRSRGRW